VLVGFRSSSHHRVSLGDHLGPPVLGCGQPGGGPVQVD
jgi:hypothetical protein